MIYKATILFFLIGSIWAQEKSISGSTRRNRFSAGKSQAVDFNCPEDFGYYSHPSDCSQYYVCVFGGALLESCTGGLMYSTELQTCDWPRNVVCQTSTGPGVSTVKITDPRTKSRNTNTNAIHSATESLTSSSSILSRGIDNTIRTRQTPKSQGTSKSIFDDPSKGRQGRFLSNQGNDPQRIDNGFQAQETSSRAFNVVPSAPAPKVKFPWSSFTRKKSRKPRDVSFPRQIDDSSPRHLSTSNNRPDSGSFDISFPSSAIFSAGPRERIVRQTYDERDYVRPSETSFFTSSFNNPFQPRHALNRRPILPLDNHSRHSSGERRFSVGGVRHRNARPESIFPSNPSRIRNFNSNGQHTPRNPFYPPNSRERVREFRPRDFSSPPQRNQPLHPIPVRVSSSEPPKSVGTSNFAMGFSLTKSQAFEDPFFRGESPNYENDYQDSDYEYYDNSFDQREYEPVNLPVDNLQPIENFNSKNEFQPRPRPVHSYESEDHYKSITPNQNNDRFAPPPIKGSVLLTSDSYDEIVSREDEKSIGRHIDDEESLKIENDVNEIPPPKIKTRIILTKQSTPKRPTRRPFRNQKPTKPNPKPTRRPQRAKTSTTQTLRKPPHIPGTARQPELSKLNIKDNKVTADISPSLPGTSSGNRFSPARSSTKSPPQDSLYQDLLNLNDTDYYYYYDDILYDDYYDANSAKNKPTTTTTTASPFVRSRTPARSRGKASSKKSVSQSSLPSSSLTSRGRDSSRSSVSNTFKSPSSLKSNNPTSSFSSFPNAFSPSRSTGSKRGSSTSSTSKAGRKTQASSSKSAPRGSSRSKPKASSGSPKVVGRTPQRPNPLYPQPQVDVTAAPCDKTTCKLPDCYCGGRDIPEGLKPSSVPQLVLLTFDDAVNDLNKGLYRDLFERGRVNPNGCPIAATFYVSHEWTDYTQVQNLYADGHEIASHSVTHSFGEQFSTTKWAKEIGGQREIMSAYGGVRMEDIRGMRAPFLAVGGNNMFRMLYDLNFTYDSSMPVYENNPPSWPYTLDYKIFHDCMIPPCPTNSYPGVWQVPMVMWQDLTGGRCSMGDACTTPPDAEGVYKMLIKNFERHYTTNRSPFGLFYHAAWFTTPHHKEGFIAFLDTISAMDDVWLVTNWQALQWVRDPTPLNRAKSFPPFQCDYPERPPRCTTPKVCNVWHKGSVRYLKTCYACPESYPWTGNTGVKSPLNDL